MGRGGREKGRENESEEGRKGFFERPLFCVKGTIVREKRKGEREEEEEEKESVL